MRGECEGGGDDVGSGSGGGIFHYDINIIV